MSALGVTDWYNTHVTSPSPPTQIEQEMMLFGTLPVDFVREAKAKFGGQFFAAIPRQRGVRLGVRHAIFGKKAMGTMRPFSTIPGDMAMDILRTSSHTILDSSGSSFCSRLECIERRKRAGTSGWNYNDIQKEFDIRPHGETVPAIITWCRQDTVGVLQGTVLDFYGALRDLAGKDRIYAFMLWDSQGWQQRVLLQSPRIKIPGPRRLVKIGCYDTFYFLVPESTAVDWIIL
jgi:hypothetical protein